MNLYEGIKKNLNEAVDLNRLKAAKDRKIKLDADDDQRKRDKFLSNIGIVYRVLGDDFDSYLEVGKFLYDENIVKWGIPANSYDVKDPLIYCNGWNHNFGIIHSGDYAFRAYGVEGGGYCGDVGIIFTKDVDTGVILSNENLEGVKHDTIDDVSGAELDHYLSMSEDAANPSYNNVDKFVTRIEDIANRYEKKYPELSN